MKVYAYFLSGNLKGLEIKKTMFISSEDIDRIIIMGIVQDDGTGNKYLVTSRAFPK